MNKYCEKAYQLDSGKSLQTTQTVGVMRALNLLMSSPSKQFEAAMIMSNTMEDLLIEGNAELEQFITGEHLAYYFVLSCVAHMSRLDIK